MLTDAQELVLILVWGVLSIISAVVLFNMWDSENKYEGDETTLLTYIGAGVFGTMMAPVISALALFGWLGTITPKDAKRWISNSVETFKEASVGHWRDLFGKSKMFSKQAPPHISVGTTGGIMVNPNPPSLSTIHSGPYINDMMNIQTRHTASLQPSSHSFHPHPNISRGVGPNRMTRMSNGSVAPSWYVPKAKKAWK